MNAVRKFEDVPARRLGHVTPLIIGVTGASSAGKTWSALRLATGIQRVTGGEIFGIDTDDDRMLHYADFFKFRHVPFFPPHGALDYMAAVDHCISRGARIVVIDNMSDEHDGEGGLLDQMDDYIDRKLAIPENSNKSRDTYLMSSQIKPKRDRKKLNRRIVHAARAAVFILCYRAEEKIKPKKGGGQPEDMGWQPISSSKLPYSMTVRFLLLPGSNGAPIFQPTVPGERMLVKNPEQFKDWFRAGDQLSEDLGERLAMWARGGVIGDKDDPVNALLEGYARCSDEAAFTELEKRRGEIWKKQEPRKPQLKEASDATRKRLDEAKAAATSAGTSGDTPDNAKWIATLTEQPSSAELTTTWGTCTEAYGGLVPLDVSDAYEATNERLVEQEAKQQY